MKEPSLSRFLLPLPRLCVALLVVMGVHSANAQVPVKTPKLGIYKGALTAIHTVQHGGSPARVAKVQTVSRVTGIAAAVEGGNQPLFDLVSPGFTIIGHAPASFATLDFSTTPVRLRVVENGVEVDLPLPEVSVEGNGVTVTFESVAVTGTRTRTSRYVMRLVRTRP